VITADLNRLRAAWTKDWHWARHSLNEVDIWDSPWGTTKGLMLEQELTITCTHACVVLVCLQEAEQEIASCRKARQLRMIWDVRETKQGWQRANTDAQQNNLQKKL